MRAGLKTYNVQFLPRGVPLSRFEGIPDKKAQKILQQARLFDVKERFMDTTIIKFNKNRNLKSSIGCAII